ncbi:hypothetical protein [Streptomyces sp. NBC_01236]|uniref:hypothetical protein n=1 Tax=Streptomyces sp. NBC_01236 TaxID=2903789 RepID=UPI002E12375E|nr:hypothetical protein OG324_00615 [Streptomyces sp. NBC_01236]
MDAVVVPRHLELGTRPLDDEKRVLHRNVGTDQVVDGIDQPRSPYGRLRPLLADVRVTDDFPCRTAVLGNQLSGPGTDSCG